MGIFDDIRKTVNYAKRNGISAAFDAAVERLSLNRTQYAYAEPDKETLKRQQGEYSRAVFEAGQDPTRPRPILFSILTPLYITDREQLAQMIESVKRQTWGGWELILTDASPVRQKLGTTVDEVSRDGRIFYYNLSRNEGIAENTNAALKRANGDYIVLLDHDDLLAPDALYELARAIVSCGFEQARNQLSASPAMKQSAQMKTSLSYRCMLAYSDEDKFADEAGKERRFFEPHYKPDFDFDRLLTNNYICHLTTIRADIAKRLQFRAAFDGAQDYDLFLRTCALAVFSQKAGEQNAEASYLVGVKGAIAKGYRPLDEVQSLIAHVPKVLYHWRSHALSTAANPASKTYAYDAGQKALEEFARIHFNGNVKVEPMKHLGFYYIRYEDEVFYTRPDIGIVGGKVADERGTLIGGRMDEEGNVFYEGLKRGQSGGYQHSAVLEQEADAVDLRNMSIRPELEPLFRSLIATASDDVRNIITIINGKVIIGDFITPQEAEKIRQLNAVSKEKQSADTLQQTVDRDDLEARFAHLDHSLEEVTSAGAKNRNNHFKTQKRPQREASSGGHIDISVGEGEDAMSLLNASNRSARSGMASRQSGTGTAFRAGTVTAGGTGASKGIYKQATTAYGSRQGASASTGKSLSSSATTASDYSAQTEDIHSAEEVNVRQEMQIPLVEIDPAELKNLSLAFCKAVREKGYRIVWDPQK